MTKIILITGGARSGKSQYAESLYIDRHDVTYIATSIAADPEMAERVRLHQLSRPVTWKTFEAASHLDAAVSAETRYYLLDCLSVFTSNIMFEMTKTYDTIPVDVQQQIEEKVMTEITLLMQKIQDIDGTLVIVTNEVGLSIVPEHHIARVYRDILGKVNQRTAALCHEVYLVVCGIPLQLRY